MYISRSFNAFNNLFVKNPPPPLRNKKTTTKNLPQHARSKYRALLSGHRDAYRLPGASLSSATRHFHRNLWEHDTFFALLLCFTVVALSVFDPSKGTLGSLATLRARFFFSLLTFVCIMLRKLRDVPKRNSTDVTAEK